MPRHRTLTNRRDEGESNRFRHDGRGSDLPEVLPHDRPQYERRPSFHINDGQLTKERRPDALIPETRSGLPLRTPV